MDSGDFKQMKEHIQQVIADMFADIKTLIDIITFRKHWSPHLEKKESSTLSKTKLSKLQRRMYLPTKLGLKRRKKLRRTLLSQEKNSRASF